MFWDGERWIDEHAPDSTTPGARGGWVERPSGLLIRHQPQPSGSGLLTRRLLSAGRFVGPVVLVEVLRRLLELLGT
jgi:hypothetical protein